MVSSAVPEGADQVHRSCDSAGFRPPITSSRQSTSGSVASARAISRRLSSPMRQRAGLGLGPMDERVRPSTRPPARAPGPPGPQPAVEHPHPDVLATVISRNGLTIWCVRTRPRATIWSLRSPSLLAAEADAARRGADAPTRQREERRLPRAVRADDTEDLLRLNLERNRSSARSPPKRLAHRGHGEDGSALSRHRAPPRLPAFAAAGNAPEPLPSPMSPWARRASPR